MLKENPKAHSSRTVIPTWRKVSTHMSHEQRLAAEVDFSQQVARTAQKQYRKQQRWLESKGITPERYRAGIYDAVTTTIITSTNNDRSNDVHDNYFQTQADLMCKDLESKRNIIFAKRQQTEPTHREKKKMVKKAEKVIGILPAEQTLFVSEKVEERKQNRKKAWQMGGATIVASGASEGLAYAVGASMGSMDGLTETVQSVPVLSNGRVLFGASAITYAAMLLQQSMPYRNAVLRFQEKMGYSPNPGASFADAIGNSLTENDKVKEKLKRTGYYFWMYGIEYFFLDKAGILKINFGDFVRGNFDNVSDFITMNLQQHPKEAAFFVTANLATMGLLKAKQEILNAAVEDGLRGIAKLPLNKAKHTSQRLKQLGKDSNIDNVTEITRSHSPAVEPTIPMPMADGESAAS